jgi:hypothetical protein
MLMIFPKHVLRVSLDSYSKTGPQEMSKVGGLSE